MREAATDFDPELYNAEARDRELERRAGKRQRWNRYCDAFRAGLIAGLGGRCVECGESDAAALEFDHLAPRTWESRRKSRLTRLRLYKEEARLGVLVLRCRSCNARKGKPAPPPQRRRGAR